MLEKVYRRKKLYGFAVVEMKSAIGEINLALMKWYLTIAISIDSNDVSSVAEDKRNNVKCGKRKLA